MYILSQKSLMSGETSREEGTFYFCKETTAANGGNIQINYIGFGFKRRATI